MAFSLAEGLKTAVDEAKNEARPVPGGALLGSDFYLQKKSREAVSEPTTRSRLNYRHPTRNITDQIPSKD